METCVLIPQEFSLTITTLPNKNAAEITVWSIADIPQGTLFHPFQGTIRLDRMESFPCLKEDDVRYRFGLYDEISYIFGRRVRHCNWIRFLRVANSYDTSVNIVCTRVKGEPLYEVIRPIGLHSELVVYFLPERRDDVFLEHKRALWFRQTMDSILEESPLDLSMSLLQRVILPISPVSNSEDEHKSITSETSSSGSISFSNENTNDLLLNDSSLGSKMIKYQTPKTTTRAGRGERTYLPCEVCGKAFDRPSLLKRHMRTHTGEKPHVCMVCSKGFSTSSSLNTHRRIHSGEKPHECQVCGKRFTASSNLYYHRMTHVKDKPHKCNLCSKSFPTPGDLKSHMYVHSGTWPFKCHICFRGFSKQTNLKNHLFLHTGDKPHACELCNKKFALACNLRAHMKTHEGDPQDECVQCGKVFVSTATNTRQQMLCSRCCGGSGSNGGSTDDLTDADAGADADVEKTGFHADESTGDESSNGATEYSDK